MSLAKNFEQIRNDYLRDLQNQNPSAHVHEGSDNHVRATALGVAVEGIYQHQEWIVDQIFADTATPENLERHAAELGITRKNGTFAAGRVRISGTPNASVAANTAIAVDDAVYRTSAAIRLNSSGTAETAVVSDGIGVAYNQAANTPAKLVSAPAGVQTDAVLLSMTGGTEPESDAALLARYLYRRRNQPAGGNRHDYYAWAMEVPGVADAFVYPLRRGLGTVDVAIIASDGLPSSDVVAAAQQYIDANRPVTAKNVLVLAPKIKTINVAVKAKISADTAFATVRNEIDKACRVYFGQLKPGSLLVKSQLESAVSQVYGVIDRVVSSPAANITAATDETGIEWIRLGRITVEQML